MDKKFSLKIVSPSRYVFDDQVEMAIMRSVEGDFAVLKGHENLTTVLANGVLKYVQDGKTHEMALLGGFVEVSQQGVTILTDACELPNEIDPDRAQKARERALERLKNKQSDIDIQRAEMALQRSLVRLEVVEKRF